MDGRRGRGGRDPRAALLAGHPHLRRPHAAPVDPRRALGHEPRQAAATRDEARPHRHRHAPARAAHRQDPRPPGHRRGPAPPRAHRRRGLRHRRARARQSAAPVPRAPTRSRAWAASASPPTPARTRRSSTSGRRSTSSAPTASATAARRRRPGAAEAAGAGPDRGRVCLSSNYHTGAVPSAASPTPSRRFLEAGVPVALCCDNSTVSRTDAVARVRARGRAGRPRRGRGDPPRAPASSPSSSPRRRSPRGRTTDAELTGRRTPRRESGSERRGRSV